MKLGKPVMAEWLKADLNWKPNKYQPATNARLVECCSCGECDLEWRLSCPKEQTWMWNV